MFYKKSSFQNFISFSKMPKITFLSQTSHYYMENKKKSNLLSFNTEYKNSYHIWKKCFMAFFLWMGFNCLKATATLRRQFTFYHSVFRNSWYSFYWPWKDERLSQLWSHQAVLNTGPMERESSALTTRLPTSGSSMSSKNFSPPPSKV